MIEGRNFAYLGAIRSDGSAAVTPVWVDLADDLVVVNGVTGRAWAKHLLADPRVTVCVTHCHAGRDRRHRRNSMYLARNQELVSS
jgi:Pyridoxamine 5'-phosphate oxidase